VNWILSAAASAQPVLVAAVLAWAGVLKLRDTDGEAAGKTALAGLVGERRAPLAFRAVGAVELVLAVALLVTPVAAIVSAVWAAGLLGYLAYARKHAPESSCGCLGKAHTPVRGRSFGRAGLLLVAGAAGAFGGAWWAALGAHSGAGAAVVLPLLVVELAVVLTLSPELDQRWLLPLRRWRVQLRHPLAGTEFAVPVESSVVQLTRSPAYLETSPALRSDLLDHWDEGEWRLLTYSVTGGTAVFAVPRLRYDPEAVKVAVVPDEAPDAAEQEAPVPVG
jgi:hypothetical protein